MSNIIRAFKDKFISLIITIFYNFNSGYLKAFRL